MYVMYVNYVMNTSQHNGVPFVQYNYLGKQLAYKYNVDQYNLYLNLLLGDLPWQADERRKERERGQGSTTLYGRFLISI